MEFLRSYFIKNKPLSSWTLFSSNLDSSSKLLESHFKHFAKSSEWLSNVLITGESNFDEKSVQLPYFSNSIYVRMYVTSIVEKSYYVG